MAFDTILNFLPWAPFHHGSTPNNPLITDPVNLGYLWHQFFQSNIEKGIIPLWNNLTFCGKPVLPYSYPFFYIFYSLFSLTLAHDLLLFMHLVFIGIFTYLYLKEIGIETTPSIIGAISWMFNGYVMVWFEFEPFPMIAATLPAILFFIEKWWKTNTALSFLGIIAISALSVGIGFPHLLIYQFIFIGMYLIYRCFNFYWKKQYSLKQSTKQLLHPISAFLISFIISSIFFTTHIMMLEEGHRKPFEYNELFEKTGQLPGQYLTTLLFPKFYGTPVISDEILYINNGTPVKNIMFTPGSDSQIYNNYNELCIYAGILSLFFTLACLPYLGKKQYISFFGVTAVLCILMAMGSFLYYPLARFVPGLSLSTPTRILYIFGFSMSILTAFGADILLKNPKMHIFFITSSWILLVGVASGIIFFMQTEPGIKWAIQSVDWIKHPQFIDFLRSHFALSSQAMLKPACIIVALFIPLLCFTHCSANKHRMLFLWLCIIMHAYDLMSFGLSYNTAVSKKLAFPPTDSIQFLQKDKSLFRIISFGRFLYNSFAAFGIEDIGGYSPFYPRRYGEYLHISQAEPDTPPPEQFSRWTKFRHFSSPLMDIINTKYILLPSNWNLKSDRHKLVYDSEIKIYENLNVMPRFFWASQYYLALNPKDALDTLDQFSLSDFQHTVILESKPPEKFTRFIENKKNKPQNAKIKLISYTPNQINMEVESDYDGFIVVSDQYYPGWFAEIDGKRTEILRANYIMRAIPVPSGHHKVDMKFRPKPLIASMILSFVGWTALVGTILVFLWKRRSFNKVRRSLT
ncbi:YfhO family protein [Desulfococcaceae bacterium HSG7]|nr:YfhO family protein [Desulfococcaceae bacterium HSG7]